MAFSNTYVSPTISNPGRFWPLFILLGIVVICVAQFHLSNSQNPYPSEAPAPSKQLLLRDTSPQALPFPVIKAIVHYATTKITPQQTTEEIMVTANILSRRGPCNLLVFGLGFDSPLWHALNHGGTTMFLEEDNGWIAKMAQSHPYLKSYAVNYTTILSDADNLIAYARKEKDLCSADTDLQRSSCKLALKNLPEQVYTTTWDVIMIDAPTGYHPKAPGRMGAIFSSAVMARKGKREQSIDILVHDVDRPVEKRFSSEFLCSKNLVEAVGKLWHFLIFAQGDSRGKEFCY